MSSQKSVLCLILLLAFVRGVIYASVVPPWQSPDEPAQFERARASLTVSEWQSTVANGPDWYHELAASLFVFNLWNFIDDPRPEYDPAAPTNRYIPFYNELYGGLYGSQPAYAMIGLPLFIARGQDLITQLYLVRINTVLMNVLIIYISYLLVRMLFPSDLFLIFGVPLLILFNPQHTHLLSTVNNGNLAELLTTITLFFMVRAIVNGFTWINVLAVFSFMAAAMWTKATAYFLLFTLAVMGVFYFWRFRRYWPWLVLAGLIAVSGLFYMAPQMLILRLQGAWSHLSGGNYHLDPIVPLDMFRTFWAMPGWMMIRLHPFWYQLLAVLSIMALLGLITWVFRKSHLIFLSQFQPRIQALIILAVSAIVAVGIPLIWSAIEQTVVYRQARSFYPVIIPLSLLLMLGWRQLIPRDWQISALGVMTISLFIFDSIVLFQYVIPFFYSRY